MSFVFQSFVRLMFLQHCICILFCFGLVFFKLNGAPGAQQRTLTSLWTLCLFYTTRKRFPLICQNDQVQQVRFAMTHLSRVSVWAAIMPTQQLQRAFIEEDDVKIISSCCERPLRPPLPPQSRLAGAPCHPAGLAPGCWRLSLLRELKINAFISLFALA